MTVGEVVYFILDACKLISDDTTINENHALFLAKKYRSFLIKKEQEREQLSTDSESEFEYQQICLDLEKTAAMDGEPCTGGYYLRTVQKIPKTLEGSTPRVYPVDFYQGIRVVYISRDRMRYVGTNKYLRSIIWVSLGPDMHLYIKSDNPQFMYLKKIRMSAVFEDFDDVSGLLCDNDGSDVSCDVMSMTFPIREYLIPQLLELCIKDLTGFSYKPADNLNNASDDLSNMMSFIRRNAKSGLQKAIEE